jgi:hypothetical protein
MSKISHGLLGERKAVDSSYECKCPTLVRCFEMFTSAVTILTLLALFATRIEQACLSETLCSGLLVRLWVGASDLPTYRACLSPHICRSRDHVDAFEPLLRWS